MFKFYMKAQKHACFYVFSPFSPPPPLYGIGFIQQMALCVIFPTQGFTALVGAVSYGVVYLRQKRIERMVAKRILQQINA